LLALKRLSLARHNASPLLVVVSLYLGFVSLNYSFIINKLFVLARTIDRLHSLSCSSSEWVNRQFG